MSDSDPRARRDADLLASLKSERSTLSQHYQELARFIWPDQAIFFRSPGVTPEGEKRAQEIVDPTAPIAADRCASMLMSMTAPTHKQYQKLSIDAEDLADNPEIKEWLEVATDTLFRQRYAPGTGFAAQYHEGCKSAVVFGPRVTFVEDALDRGIRYIGLSMATTYFSADSSGRIVGLAREESFNASQLADKFGADALPAKVLKALNSSNQAQRLQQWPIVHIVEPHPKEGGRFKYLSRYSMADGTAVLEERGYRCKPFAVARASTMPGEKYGRSISMLVLPAIKGLNKAVADYISAIHRQVDPPLLAFDDDATMSAIVNKAGRVTVGGLDSEGRHLVAPLSQPGNLSWAKELIERQSQQLNDAYMTTLFQILTTEPSSREQTAYEVSVREVEKAALLSPATDRQTDEYFGDLVPREIDILIEGGRLPPWPEALRGREHEIKITHTGELSLAQQADEIMGISRTLEALPLFEQLDPTAKRRLKGSDMLKRFAEGVGLSPNLIRTDDETEQLAQADEQAQSAAAVAQLAPAAGSAAKDFATAEQLRQGNAASLGNLV